MEDNSALRGEVALVTGASRGIGLAIALTLGRRGAYVVGTATSEPGAQLLTENLRKADITGHGVVLDVTQTEQAVALVEQLEQAGQAISVLVNNAGITRDGLLMRMKEDDWEAVIDTNLSSVFRMSRACVRSMMKARRGRIISIGSVVGHSGNFGQTNYAASKAAVIGFTRSLAREVGSRGITVNAIAPGFIDTDMTRGLPEEQRQALLAQVPLARLGLPDEIAQAAAFLASRDAAYITGTVLHVNGGLYMG